MRRCGQCKQKTYCSPECQKEDWRFHRRACAPPAKPKPKESDAPKSAPLRPKAADHVVDDDDEVGDWYRHREWAPSEGKKQFAPTKLAETNGDDAVKAGSEWNKAGTWEEVDRSAWAKGRLKELVLATVAESPYGQIRVGTVDIDGDATVRHIRGTTRHCFDFVLSVNYTKHAGTDAGAVKVEFSDGLAARGEYPAEGGAASVREHLVPCVVESLQAFYAEFMPASA